MDSNFEFIELASYKRPELVEDRKDEWVLWGEDHSYFDYLLERYRKSTTHNSVVNNMARLAYGRGLYAKDAARRPNDYAAMKVLLSPDVVRATIFELKVFGNAALQILYNKNHTRIERIAYAPTKQFAAEKCNEDGIVEGYYFSDDWTDVRKYPPKRYSAYGTSKDAIEILYIKPFSVGTKYYATPDYEGAIPYCVLEEEIAEFLINTVMNGFSATKVINFNNGIPPIEEQRDRAAKVKGSLTGSRGDKIIVSFNHDETKKTTIDDIPLDDAPAHYEYVSKEAQEKILNAHNVTSPMIVGVVTANQGFSSNADEIEVAARYFYNTAIQPLQDVFLEHIEQVLAFNNISLDLYFRRLNLMENIDEVQQATEESTQLSSQLTDYIAQYGEDLGEGWELIDERDVDYEREVELDSQLKSWAVNLAKQNKPTLLSRLKTKLAGTGTATPRQVSEQDAEKDGFYFKVRYKYSGDATGEREFCKAMLSADKLYRKEDLERMNSELVNPGQGHEGQPYNIFLYKGGVNCHHVFRRLTFVSAEATGKVGDEQTVQVSNAQARKFGYDVSNPPEAYTQPRYMKNNGHHPDYGK